MSKTIRVDGVDYALDEQALRERRVKFTDAIPPCESCGVNLDESAEVRQRHIACTAPCTARYDVVERATTRREWFARLCALLNEDEDGAIEDVSYILSREGLIWNCTACAGWLNLPGDKCGCCGSSERSE